MAVKRWRVSAIAGKVEPVSGTDSVPTLAANAVNFIGLPPELVVAYLESGDRGDVVYGGMGGEVAPSAPAGRYGTLRVRMEAKGNNLGYNETGVQFAEVDAFLRAASTTSPACTRRSTTRSKRCRSIAGRRGTSSS
jgi:hypothetical protein